MTRGVRSWLIWPLVIVSLMASACAREASLPGPDEGADGSSAQPSAQPGVCGLLAPRDVDVAINAPLGGPPNQGQARPILVGMAMCSFRSGASGVSWGVLGQAAADRFRQYTDLNRPYVESLDVGGRQAFWDRALRTLVVLDEAQAFGLRLAVENPPVARDERATYEKRTARRLAEIAMERMPDAQA